MAKGVIINLNSGSDYTDCAIYTGLTETTATGTTEYTSVVGGTVDLSGLDDTLTEVYVKIVCVGCCEQVFYVCLVTPDPTPTPTTSPTTTPTNTPSNTPDVTPSNTPSNTPDVTPSNTPTTTSTPTITPTNTVTPSSSSMGTPTLTMLLFGTYQLVSGGTIYSVSSTSPTSTNSQTVYCQISDREDGAQIYGATYRYYSNPLAVGTRLYGYTAPYNPAVNLVGYFNALSSIGLPSGTTYYVKTDSNGYITDYVAMDYCWLQHNIVWSFNYDCTTSCDLIGGTGAVVYTEGNNNSWGNGMLVYSDPQRTTYFPSGRYIKYQGYIWENNGSSGLTEICIVGQPC